MVNRWMSLVLALGMVGLMKPELVWGQFPNRPDFFEEGRTQFEEEIRRLEQLPESASVLTVDQGEMKWSHALIREGGIALWFPQGPWTQDRQEVETNQGGVEFTVLATHPLEGRFMLAYSESLGERNISLRTILEQVRDRLIEQSSNFSLTTEQEITGENYSGRNLTLRNEQEILSIRIILGEDRLYVLGVNQKIEANQSAVETFFSSFEFLSESN